MGPLALAGVAAAAALLVTTALTGFLIGLLSRRGVVDVPNRRSSHETPTPRGGGLGVLAGLASGYAVLAFLGAATPDPILVLALMLTAAAGLADDLRGGIPVSVRLAMQVVAAAMVLWRLGPLERIPLPAPADLQVGVWGWILGLVWIVGFVNLTNFLDGIDGLAAGQGTLAGLTLAIAATLRGDEMILYTGFVLAAACLGFLRHNWHPARVFLGDVGSSSIGFVLATAAWAAPRPQRSELIFLTAMATWFFLADGTHTLLLRAYRGEPLWRAHRQHLYQRLTATGWSHAEVVRWILGLGLTPALLAAAGYGLQKPSISWTALATAPVLFVFLWRQVVMREQLA